MNKYYLSIIFFLVCLAFVPSAQASYPQTANYFLKWTISDEEALRLAKYDLLILDMEVQYNSPAQLRKIRELNPDVLMLAYLSSVDIVAKPSYIERHSLRDVLLSNIADSWWLRDLEGLKVSFWPGSDVLNISTSESSLNERYYDYLPDFVNEEIVPAGVWNGVFYDNLWSDVCWLNNGNIDLDNDAQAEDCASINSAWSAGAKLMLEKSRRIFPADFLIAGNGQSSGPLLTSLNGLMMENFPAYWEANGSWSDSMLSYKRLDEEIKRRPQINIINRSCGRSDNFSCFRFGLASTLLGNAYYSVDYGVSDHGQTWWYDEYDVDLGRARSFAYNLLENSNDKMRDGFWRRDFDYGAAFVNSTQREQTIIFKKEDFEKINGLQDPVINNGERVNYLRLAPNDGVVLLKRNLEIIGSVYTNGHFARVLNDNGKNVRDGFFSYLASFPGGQEILTVDLNDDEILENVVAVKGQLKIYHQGKLNKSFTPFGDKFKGNLSFAFDRDLVVAAGTQVRIFSSSGKLLGQFPVSNKNGANLKVVAASDKVIIFSDSKVEPLIRIFNRRGQLEKEFFVFDKNFKGGLSVAVGDINNDGQVEIVAAPLSNGSPQVMIFNLNGRLLGQFLAYKADFKNGVYISLSDVNNDGRLEILASAKSF